MRNMETLDTHTPKMVSLYRNLVTKTANPRASVDILRKRVPLYGKEPIT